MSLANHTCALDALPNELKMEIMSQYFGNMFPKGIDPERFHIVQKKIYDNLASLPCLTDLVAEFLFKSRKLILEAQQLGPENKPYYAMRYPPAYARKNVRELEFRFVIPTFRNVLGPWRQGTADLVEFQVSWLKRFVADEFGFDKLEKLRIVVPCPQDRCSDSNEDHLVQYLRDMGGIGFPVKELEISFDAKRGWFRRMEEEGTEFQGREAWIAFCERNIRPLLVQVQMPVKAEETV